MHFPYPRKHTHVRLSVWRPSTSQRIRTTSCKVGQVSGLPIMSWFQSKFSNGSPYLPIRRHRYGLEGCDACTLPSTFHHVRPQKVDLDSRSPLRHPALRGSPWKRVIRKLIDLPSQSGGDRWRYINWRADLMSNL